MQLVTKNINKSTSTVDPVGKYLFEVSKITLEQRPNGRCSIVILWTLNRYLLTVESFQDTRDIRPRIFDRAFISWNLLSNREKINCSNFPHSLRLGIQKWIVLLFVMFEQIQILYKPGFYSLKAVFH